MSKKLAFVLSLFVLLYPFLCVRFKPVKVNAPNGYPVHNLDTGLNYTTIQEAIDAAETVSGHTVLVDPGTYYELVRVHKSVSLIGKNKTTTIIDGNRTGTVIRVTADNVYISGFTIRNSSQCYLCSGIILDNTRNTTIADNVICGGDVCIFLKDSRGNSILNNAVTNPDGRGICLRSSSGNKISGNNISEVDFGTTLKDSSDNNIISGNNITKTDGTSVGLSSSSFNTLRNNALSKFGVWGSSLEHFIHDIDESNTVGGKPIYYWVNQHGRQVPSDAGYAVAVNSTDVTVKDLTFDGRLLFVHTNNSRIENVTIETPGDYGIRLYFCNNNTISNNQLNAWGRNIQILSSNNNLLIGNNVTRGGYENLVLDSSSGNIVADNILSFSQHGGMGSGVWIWDGGSNIIRGNTLYANDFGVYMSNSSNNIIYNNVIRKSFRGILIEPTPFSFKYSSNNTIYNNLITENNLGIALRARCENNSIYHNNFIDNGEQVYVNARHTNFWDNGIEGNYWSNYTGVDLNHDGIGDGWHQINENNTDHYPMMGMFNSFNTSLDYDVNVISNSTIKDFEYFESNSTIRIHVSNITANQTYGFCRLYIQKSLMPPPYTVIIDDGLTEALHFNNTIYDNATHRWIYFAYPHSTHEIHIIPEFQSIIIMPLLMVVTLLVATIYESTRSRSPQEH